MRPRGPVHDWTVNDLGIIDIHNMLLPAGRKLADMSPLRMGCFALVTDLALVALQTANAERSRAEIPLFSCFWMKTSSLNCSFNVQCGIWHRNYHALLP
jgi:hypothetical protein